MEVIKANPCGYCKGVIRAIQIAKKTREENPDATIHILGMLVHNRYVTEALEKLNIISLKENGLTRLELLDQIDEGIVIFSAHGVSNQVHKKAKEKQLTIVDASCLDVIKTKNIIEDYLQQNYEIIYIGVKGHPEAEGVIGDDSVHIHLVETAEDIQYLSVHPKYFVTNQTTMNINEIQLLLNIIKERFPDAVFSDEICSATRSRQEAVYNLKDLDILYVVGDPKSNNTRNLAKCADASVKKVFCIENVKGINLDDLKGIKKVGVTSGASTPTALTNQVIDYLRNRNENDPLPSVVTEIL